MPQTLAAAAALLAAFFVQPAHADGKQAAASYVCLAESDILELAALDEQKERTVADMVALMRLQMRTYKCFALSPQPFRLVTMVYRYNDADGVPSEVWQGLLPEATRLTFTILTTKASEA
tara:strand:+ start:174 stop:533 length:360 start_codon:yes stop_codon:yes gene_type:complete